ncbi:basic proline-rich protein-like [Moschus berezovskii]|uniref:basic proline-rich protein-like n=1 Tax=Moschus berezovskii TaxID=68408 RepID=UPI0024442120|nr:basic proline-rich protein-like [Moschus berezovskii]
MLQRGNPTGEENTAPPPLLLLLTGACPSPAPRSGRPRSGIASPCADLVRCRPSPRPRRPGPGRRRGPAGGGGDPARGPASPAARASSLGAPPRAPGRAGGHGSPPRWARPPREGALGKRGFSLVPPGRPPAAPQLPSALPCRASQTPGLPLGPGGAGPPPAGARASAPPRRALRVVSPRPYRDPGLPAARAPTPPARRGRGDWPPRGGPQRPCCPSPRGPGEPGPRASGSPPRTTPATPQPNERSERDRLRSFSRKETLPGHCLQRQKCSVFPPALPPPLPPSHPPAYFFFFS